jgi:hypothetical protein
LSIGKAKHIFQHFRQWLVRHALSVWAQTSARGDHAIPTDLHSDST